MLEPYKKMLICTDGSSDNAKFGGTKVSGFAAVRITNMGPDGVGTAAKVFNGCSGKANGPNVPERDALRAA